jgi:hypothetical protein
LTELEERGAGLILGYMPSSVEDFLLAPIYPPLIAFPGPSSCERVTGAAQRVAADSRVQCIITAAADHDLLLLHCPANALRFTITVGHTQGLQDGVMMP